MDRAEGFPGDRAAFPASAAASASSAAAAAIASAARAAAAPAAGASFSLAALRGSDLQRAFHLGALERSLVVLGASVARDLEGDLVPLHLDLRDLARVRVGA